MEGEVDGKEGRKEGKTVPKTSCFLELKVNLEKEWRGGGRAYVSMLIETNRRDQLVGKKLASQFGLFRGELVRCWFLWNLQRALERHPPVTERLLLCV
mmetsp:Transcript_15213/g.30831  ORF Transcript_15213/g.30831 Transcript_15213/m.30831 type:complete len:98 (-) Transcript_15213:279-572(-)